MRSGWALLAETRCVTESIKQDYLIMTFQGYKAITGVDPPFIGMCWWINGLLLPELTVVRGETYYFKVTNSETSDL